jgi:hypothetical protein
MQSTGEIFYRRQNGRNVKLTNNIYIVPRSRVIDLQLQPLIRLHGVVIINRGNYASFIYVQFVSLTHWLCAVDTCTHTFVLYCWCSFVCRVLFEGGVLCCVICVFLCGVSYCSTTATGKTPFKFNYIIIVIIIIIIIIIICFTVHCYLLWTFHCACYEGHNIKGVTRWTFLSTIPIHPQSMFFP